MHRSTQPPELIDAWLPPRVGRNARLERLTQLIDWAPLAALVAGLHAAPVGRPSYGAAADGESAAAPAVVPGLGPGDGRGVVGAAVVPGASWGWGCKTTQPDHSTISRFRTRLTAAGGAEPLFAAVEQQLAARGTAGQAAGHAGQDAIVGGRAGAPPAGRRRRRGQPPGPGRGLGPGGARPARFGYKLHLGVDADSELIRRAVLTPANVNETQVADELIAGDEGAVYGDAAYGTHARSTRLRALGIPDRLMRRPNKHHPRLGPNGAPPPRPDRTGAAAGGARVWHVETLVRLPASAVPGPGPQYDRDVVQAAGLQPAPRGPVAGRHHRAALGALRPQPGAVGCG